MKILQKMDKVQSLQSKYQILKLSSNAKLGHLLRSFSSSRAPVQAFCQAFGQLIFQIFLLQINLSTTNAGMGLLSLQHMAPQHIWPLWETYFLNLSFAMLTVLTSAESWQPGHSKDRQRPTGTRVTDWCTKWFEQGKPHHCLMKTFWPYLNMGQSINYSKHTPTLCTCTSSWWWTKEGRLKLCQQQDQEPPRFFMHQKLF